MSTDGLPMEQERDWVALSLLPETHRGLLPALLACFATPAALLHAGAGELHAACVACGGSAVFSPADRDRAVQQADRLLPRIRATGCTLLPLTAPCYPPLLRETACPPIVLYVLGDRGLLSRPALAVVGMRAASDYGKQTARRFARDLAEQGISVVSGLAYGIDAEAHQGALDAGGATVAVIACGLDKNYPAGNSGLKKRIEQHGVVVSEYPPGTPARRFHFPARNRIISGISLAVVVVEAGERSGALITASRALAENRDVFAVPGRIDSLKSRGCHRLIQQGAGLVTCAREILEAVALFSPDAAGTGAQPVLLPPPPPLARDEERICRALSGDPRTIDDIAEKTGLAAPEVSRLLLLLEMKGCVRSEGGNRFFLVTRDN